MPNYRRGQYDFVVDSNFTPFTMQEMLAPLSMYKDAYEKSEEAYTDLTDKADQFKYLSETLPEGSQARKIYEGYSNELNAQAQDLAQNGLNMGNRRALTNLKRRYQGEIGRLVSADAAMQEERKNRNKLRASGVNMLYAEDNLNIDQFLDNNTPNMYSINPEDLRKEGAQYAQAASSRIYGDSRIQNINKYFQDIIQTQGYNAETMAAWRQNLESIPEFNQAVQDILDGRGVTNNLTGRNYEVARQNVINGIMEGSVYQEKRNTQQNPGVLTAAQAASNALGWANHNLSVAAHGMTKDKNGRYVSQDEWMYTHDENGRRNGFSPEYEEAVKKGLVPGKNVKMGGNNVSTTKTGRQDSRKAKANMYFTEKGSRLFTTKGDRNLGTQITYAEAITKRPEIGTYVGENSDLYDYWDSGEGIYAIGHSASEQQNNQQTEDIATATDDNNQL